MHPGAASEEAAGEKPGPRCVGEKYNHDVFPEKQPSAGNWPVFDHADVTKM